MRFGSVCSGIEAASVAFEPLGWSAAWLAEIEPFPSAVLAHHYPDVPNLGDMTAIPRRVLSGEIEAPDILCGGTPCQAFSVAGLRESLSDERGNLTLTFVEIADAIDHVRARRGAPPAIILWENVPGVLSTRDNAFGCFLAGLAGEDDPLEPPGGRWANAGAVYGPARAVAWRVLDAQHFKLAQRRRRVFVVASARDGFDPASVLFEWDGLRRDSAPSRETGKGSAGGFARSVALRGREGGATAELGDEIQNCLRASSGGGDKPHVLAFGGNNTAGPIDVATARNACASASGRMDFESETFLVQPIAAYSSSGAGYWREGIGALRGRQQDSHENVCCVTGDITHTLKAEGFDASEDGTGRGQPIVVHGTQDPCVSSDTAFALGRNNGGENVLAFDTTQVTSATNRCKPQYGDPCHPLAAGAHAPAIAQVVGAMSASGSTERKQGFGWGQQDWENGYAQPHGAKVRRLTPRECERLQGFPDDYTLIPWKAHQAWAKRKGANAAGQSFEEWLIETTGRCLRKPTTQECPDGPRYKALGNSWAVPCVRWIGRRIQRVVELRSLHG